MAFWNRRSGPQDRITSEELANYGRDRFVWNGPRPGGLGSSLLAPLNELMYTSRPEDRATVIAELQRHAQKGEWETVGAWYFVRDMMTQDPDTASLVDGGLLAVDRMRVTNLAICLSPIDNKRYRQLVGHPASDDGFFGPPVFDSHFGPSRQYYFDDAIAHAARRQVRRIPTTPGVEPGPVDDAAMGIWNFGLLVHRGPLVVHEDNRDESTVVRPAVQAATGVDHERFAELIVEKTLGIDFGNALYALGAARFFEDYLDSSVVRGPAYTRVLAYAVRRVQEEGSLNVNFPWEVLTPRQMAAFGPSGMNHGVGAQP